MNEIKKLIDKANELKHYYEQAAKATTNAEVDEAKVKGLAIYQETARQVNRAYHDLQEITRTRRAELTTQAAQAARALANAPKETHLGTIEAPAITEAKPAKKVTPKKTTAKKTAKKAAK